jgi:hypothetical protein
MTDARVAAFLRACGLEEARVVRLAGDASTRTYHRVHPARGPTSVLMDMGTPLPPEGRSPGEDGFPFLRWRHFYAELGLRVPEVRGADRAAGLVLLEDLGDELLQYRLQRLGVDACAALYDEAVASGLRLGTEGTARFVPDAADSDDPLTPRRLAWETDFFLTHALRLEVGALDEASGALREARDLLRELCGIVHADATGAPRPLALCHRDYHARNLAVVPARRGGGVELAILDFQDTRRGPRAYDLVSLAFDPYVTLPPSLVRRATDAWRPAGVADTEWETEVRLAAGQRLIKAAGSYAYLSGQRGKPEYALWFRPALARAFDQLAPWPRASALRAAFTALGLPVAWS